MNATQITVGTAMVDSNGTVKGEIKTVEIAQGFSRELAADLTLEMLILTHDANATKW